jgi:hypothetical protein
MNQPEPAPADVGLTHDGIIRRVCERLAGWAALPVATGEGIGVSRPQGRDQDRFLTIAAGIDRRTAGLSRRP